jgi:hypothetical protein
MNRSDSPLTLQATASRYYVASMLPIVVAMAAGSAIVMALMGGPWLLVLGSAVGGAFGTFLFCGVGVARARLELRDGVLDAPGIGFKQRVIIPIEQIDTTQSSRRSTVQRFLGERLLWTRDGRRVVLNERWFAPGRLVDLWIRLGCQP